MATNGDGQHFPSQGVNGKAPNGFVGLKSREDGSTSSSGDAISSLPIPKIKIRKRASFDPQTIDSQSPIIPSNSRSSSSSILEKKDYRRTLPRSFSFSKSSNDAPLPSTSYLDIHHGSVSRAMKDLPSHELLVRATRDRAKSTPVGEGRPRIMTMSQLRTLTYLTGPHFTDDDMLPPSSPSPFSKGLEQSSFRLVDDERRGGGVGETETEIEAETEADERQSLLKPPSTPPSSRSGTSSPKIHSAYGTMGAKEPEPVAFYSTARGKSGPVKPLVKKRHHLKLWWIQMRSLLVSTAFLIFIVIWALSSRFIAWSFKVTMRWISPFSWWEWVTGQNIKEVREWEKESARNYKNEKCVKSVRYYALNCGYDIEEQTIKTEDGYFLRVHRVIVPGRENVDAKGDGKGGYPVIIQHGLFQSSGSFITSEERSLAFWLASKGGYQVYLSNSRGVFDMGHESIKRDDPRFWDYNIKELAMYDLPAVVEHVKRETGYEKVAFIGHSQGNATMFCSLATGMVPSLGSSLSVFVALAPAVYAGPLTTGFPFGALKSMNWTTWRRIFGVLDFIPLMRIAYDYTPSKPFGLLGYQMFAFLFNWTDKNWLLRRKAKKFRFTPTPVSSAGIFWWTGYEGFSTRGCVLDPMVKKWWDEDFPPLSLYYGGMDYLVRVEPLIERLKNSETDVHVIRIDRMDDAEHCDFFWHRDAVELVFEKVLDDIESTKWERK